VREHLTMSQVAQKQDLSDPDVAAFARRVGNERRLTALYLLTVADMRGTSPKVWNAWKGKLLEDLYRLTVRALGGRAPDRDAEIEARKRERWPSCRAWPAARWRHRRCGRRWTWLLHAPRRRRHRLARPRSPAGPGRQHHPRARAPLAGGRRPAGAGARQPARRPVRAHLRLLRPRRLVDPGRQDPRHARRLGAGHLPGRQRPAARGAPR
jgi:hypothetical protein